MSENKIIARRRALEAALDTVNYKIQHLKPYYSREQIRCWYIERNKLHEKLRMLPTDRDLERSRSMLRKILQPLKRKES